MQFHIHDYDELTSTNDETKRLAAQNAPEGTVVYTRVQTAGRGRLGRSWAGEPGACLMFSLLLRCPLPLTDTVAWSLVAGLGVCRALRRVSGINAMVKWPNDVVCDGRKLCGILTEHIADGCLITGIGVNVNQTDFPEEICSKADSLRMLTGKAYDSDDVLQAILQELNELYATFLQTGFAPLAPAYNALCVNMNTPVRIQKPDGILEGIARGADAAGHLMVNTESGLIRLPAGEVSVRLSDGRYS